MKNKKLILSICFILTSVIITNRSFAQVGSFSCGGSFVDTRDNKTYSTVLIGRQCWFAQNLDYDNGCKAKTWTDNTDKGWCGYYNDTQYPNEGLLYQWSAAMNGSTSAGAQGVCPTGWHIPTNEEWKTLMLNLNPPMTPTQAAVTNNNWLGTTQGDQLKSVLAGCSGGVNCNTSGFNGLLTGYRDKYHGVYYGHASEPGYGYNWSSTTYDFGAAQWGFFSDRAAAYRGPGYMASGGSVRCLRNILVPTAPIDVTAVGGDAQATIWFSAPSSPGGEVTGYIVTSSAVEGLIRTGSGPGSPIIVTGLTNGALYTFTVKATNTTGTGPASPPSNQVIVKGVPRAPTDVTATAGNQQIVLNWTAPDNGGVGISNYEIYKSTTSGSFTSSPIEIGSGTGTGSASYTDTSILNGTTYYYKVAAKNGVGIGAQSVQVSTALQIAATDSFYRHIGFGRVSVFTVGAPALARFICSPFAIKTAYGPSFTDKFTTPNYINWQGSHATELEAITETINSLETCLGQNSYNQFYSSGNGTGYYWPGPSCFYNKDTISKAWANGSITQSSNNTSYIYNGTARQVDYSNLNIYLNNIGYTSCQKGILPTTVHLRTISCNNAINSTDNCSTLEARVPTSQGPYGVDLKINSSDSLVVDPGSILNLNWTSTPTTPVSTITNCIASGDWSGNKASNSSGPETLNVTPNNIPAYDYYQGIVFGTPSSRSADCTQGLEGCSSKPHFYCSPWVNDAGIFIDKPSSSTHINYQGNSITQGHSTTQAEAIAASNASLSACLQTRANYISLSKTVFDSGIYRGIVSPDSVYHCALGMWEPESGYGYLPGSTYWIYNGGLTGFYGSPWNDSACHYSGTFEEIKSAAGTNKVYLSSYDCTPDYVGYKPKVGGCFLIKESAPLFKINTVPQVTYDNSGSPKTYTLTCDYLGGKLSDSVVVKINNMSVPGTLDLSSDNVIEESRLPGATIKWKTLIALDGNSLTPENSPVLEYEFVRYDSCGSNLLKSNSDIKNDLLSAKYSNPQFSVFASTTDPWIKDGSVENEGEYVYAVRAKNRNGYGLFKMSACITPTITRSETFTLAGSGFKNGMSARLVNNETNDTIDCSFSSFISNAELIVTCPIESFTRVGTWSVIIIDGDQEYPANLTLTINAPTNLSYSPSNIRFSALDTSVIEGIITIDSITGKNIGAFANVKLVNNGKIIPCSNLSQIISYNPDGSTTWNKVECKVNNLLDFSVSGKAWEVVVTNSSLTNALSSQSGPTLTVGSCTPNCSGKVCGSNLCGGLCSGGSVVASCTREKAFGTCSGTGTKTCSGGIYGECIVTSPDPRSCTNKICGRPTISAGAISNSDGYCGSYCDNGSITLANTNSQSCSTSFGSCSVGGTKDCSASGNGYGICHQTGNTTPLVDPRIAYCSGKNCGSDICGGYCLPNSCVSPNTCSGGGASGVCGCTVPSTEHKECGVDSCGVNHGNPCAGLATCHNGQCCTATYNGACY